MRSVLLIFLLSHAAFGQYDNPRWESSLFMRYCQRVGYFGYLSSQDFSIKEMKEWRIQIDPAKDLIDHYSSGGMEPTVLKNRIIINQRVDTMYPLDEQTEAALEALRQKVEGRIGNERVTARGVQTKLEDFLSFLHDLDLLTEVEVDERSKNFRFTYGFARTHTEIDLVDYLEALIRMAEGTLTVEGEKYIISLKEASVWKRTLGAMGSGGFFIYTRPRGWGYGRGFPGRNQNELGSDLRK